ncbi:NADH-quinone oxidoreductase subunit M [Mycolicibacterium brumae]|uniref:NADH-quinone oxidoreductase subunit M n=1 Tax=Mycolicibacterium brumae TaxID=85968 RepID=A0A2G5P6L8_9MYCO|nr:NADH-quinone oxidoreductase subunit M [Mycolicibacterium brumae]MCV7194307.1 NADH-quinone oxidoreductase subunit M [Mycolicibacterium brumae]PIB73945.1 NADH-quinone oxidoreductase subunit M [Mycolicibacterium brumae]UWW09660.1 NADH-quinone oxidoreductase subunit M [Mycolicibacterium brumae]
MNLPLLTLLWAVPMLGAVAIIALPPSARDAVRWAGLAVTGAVLVIAGALAAGFDPAGAQFQFVEDHPWIPSFGTGYLLGVDGIALTLVLLTAALTPLLLIAGWNDAPDPRELNGRATHAYVALFLAVQSMVMISLVALDILLFYVFFEAMLIPMYFLIGGFGAGPRGERGRAAVKFLLYNLFGGLIMLAAVIGLYVVTANDPAFDAGTFDLRAIVAVVASGGLAVNPMLLHLLFGGFLFAFAVKAPLWPLHSWLPDAAVTSTPATAVLMMAIVDKVGTFGMLRYCLQVFPESSMLLRPLVITLAVIGIVYGAVLAIGQTDMMRLIAYTSISHFGFIILGIFVMTPQGQSGAALYMVNHGLSTAALFLIAGFLVSRRGSRMIADYGGVQKIAPVLAGAFLVAGMATLSLPGLAPFISEFLVLIGTFVNYPGAAVVASTALVLSAVYILWLYQRVMTGPTRPGVEAIGDLRSRELVVVAPLIAALLVLGFFPRPALEMINPAVNHTLSIVGEAR